MTELIKMRREQPQHEGGPVTADVHPDEVGDYQNADWQIVEDSNTSEDVRPESEPSDESEAKPKRRPAKPIKEN